MRFRSKLRLCAKICSTILGVIIVVNSLKNVSTTKSAKTYGIKDSVHSRRDILELADDKRDIFTTFGNEAAIGGVTSQWANLSVLTGDTSELKVSSLLYRVNIGDVNRRAAEGGIFNYIRELSNPCWRERLSSANPYRSNPFPAMLQQTFRQLETTFQSRLQRHGANATRTRCLPYFYVIGAPKGGSTDFFQNLVKHPNIAEPAAKEPTWWNARLGGSANARFRDYVDLYDVAAEQIWRTWKANGTQTVTGEATPSYCYDNDGWRLIPGNRDLDEPRYGVAHVIRHVTPTAKIILLLRDPTERVYSHYRNVRPHDSPEVFHDHVVKALRLLTECFRTTTIRSCFYDPKLNREILPLHMRASLYAVMLHDWLTVFPWKQVLVVKSESYFRHRADVLNIVYAFLGLDPLPDYLMNRINDGHVINDKRNRGVSMEPMLPETRNLLDNFLKPFNDRLRQLLGNEFIWKRN